MDQIFANREEAGEKLAQKLDDYKTDNALILALPRGGVVVGAVLAKKLSLPLRVIVVKKIGHPLDPEYAVGAITAGGTLVSNEVAIGDIDPKWLEEEIEQKLNEAKDRRELYSKNEGQSEIAAKQVIIVDDGVATGLTMLAAVRDVKAKSPLKIIVAVPVISEEAAETIKGEVDELISLVDPAKFLGAVGAHFRSFPEVTDQEVIKLLND